MNKINAIYTFDTSYHISHNDDYYCCVGSNVKLYDSKTGELVTIFKNIKHPSYSKFTSVGDLIVKTTTGKYHILNLDSMTLDRVLLPPKKVLGSTTDFQVTSDGKYIIDFSYIFPTMEMMVVEIETGSYQFFSLECCRGASVFQTEIDSKYYIIAHCAETPQSNEIDRFCFYELSYSSNQFQLEKLFVEQNNRMTHEAYGSSKFLMANCGNQFSILDIQNKNIVTFECEREGDSYYPGALYDLKISQNGRFVALAESNYISVYDLVQKKRVKVYEVDYGCFVDFLDNDTKLLIGTWKKGYCVSLLD